MCHTAAMKFPNFKIQPGVSIFDQVVSEAQKAILGGELTQGDAFPSVRSLSVSLRIHPNTAHKAVQYLIEERWLDTLPGIGTVVAGVPKRAAQARRVVLEQDMRRIVSEARRVGIKRAELLRALADCWEEQGVERERV